MPVPNQRDSELTCSLLTAWLADHLPHSKGLTVSGLHAPSASGFSSETLLFDAEWVQEGVKLRQALVVRVAPTVYQLFPEPRFEDHCRVMRILGRESGVPVPFIRWYEPDPRLLGAPFIVMDHVTGQVPADSPSYHVDGWVTKASPAERAHMWWRSLDVLAQIHQLDVARLGLGFVDRPEYGRTGIDQQLGYYERFLAWTRTPGLQVCQSALEWLRRKQPVEQGTPSLLWGDARLGNVIFYNFEPRAVLDWEMVTLGQPEVDLAWFLYMDRHHSEGSGVARLAGFPSQEQTVARYERLLGRQMRDMDYYEVFAAMRFAVIMARLGQLFIEFGWLPQDSDYPTNNTAARLLGAILEARC